MGDSSYIVCEKCDVLVGHIAYGKNEKWYCGNCFPDFVGPKTRVFDIKTGHVYQHDDWHVMDTRRGSQDGDDDERPECSICKEKDGILHWKDTRVCGDCYNKRLNASPEPDPVEHPPHYTSHPSGIECITITEHMNFCLGNAIKYIWRAGLKGKNNKQDLLKAAWYIDREVDRICKGTEDEK